MLNSNVTEYLAKAKPWQAERCAGLRETVHRTLPGVEEVLQYGKPHFNVDGKHAAVLHVAAAKVSFMVFDAGDVETVPGLLRSLGSGDRKVVDLREGDVRRPRFHRRPAAPHGRPGLREEGPAMRVMVMTKGDAADEGKGEPTTEMFEKMRVFNEQLVNAGIMLGGEGLKPSSAGAKIVVLDLGDLGGRRPVHRVQGGDRGLLDLGGQLAGRGGRVGQALPVRPVVRRLAGSGDPAAVRHGRLRPDRRRRDPRPQRAAAGPSPRTELGQRWTCASRSMRCGGSRRHS